ncbi:MAG: hypothetical protein IKF19_06825 [Bacilli bacterium]|nr:hypothetical protein [Bacilli bacterium]
MKDRDMYYGYGGFYPLPNQMNGMSSIDNNDNIYNINYFNDFNNRIERLERQLKRIDQRLIRLETPYVNNNYTNNEPDNNMYMM